MIYYPMNTKPFIAPATRPKSKVSTKKTMDAMKTHAKKEIIEQASSDMGENKGIYKGMFDKCLNSKEYKGLQEATVSEFKMVASFIKNKIVRGKRIDEPLLNSMKDLHKFNREGNITEKFLDKASNVIKHYEFGPETQIVKVVEKTKEFLSKGDRKMASGILKRMF